PFAALLAARPGRIVRPGRSAEYLAPHPITTLGSAPVGPGWGHRGQPAATRPERRLDLAETVDLLQRLGTATLGDLAALPTAPPRAPPGAPRARPPAAAARAPHPRRPGGPAHRRGHRPLRTGCGAPAPARARTGARPAGHPSPRPADPGRDRPGHAPGAHRSGGLHRPAAGRAAARDAARPGAGVHPAADRG